ncbi:hypothetical protein C0Q70_17113 [Pomacea canaliculata]|uniref:Uncharacterized protein n=1 Tax=Pomacea canaliculata TaxID=400727 RepID=A0A2T7NRN9_POMCA|nr:hypothetical protein C0Q70_17113 [Pomacea canaliculata]
MAKLSHCASGAVTDAGYFPSAAGCSPHIGYGPENPAFVTLALQLSTVADSDGPVLGKKVNYKSTQLFPGCNQQLAGQPASKPASQRKACVQGLACRLSILTCIP